MNVVNNACTQSRHHATLTLLIKAPLHSPHRRMCVMCVSVRASSLSDKITARHRSNDTRQMSLLSIHWTQCNNVRRKTINHLGALRTLHVQYSPSTIVSYHMLHLLFQVSCAHTTVLCPSVVCPSATYVLWLNGAS